MDGPGRVGDAGARRTLSPDLLLGASLRSFHDTAFRLETLPVYRVPGEPVEEGATETIRSIATNPYLARIARDTLRESQGENGRAWVRVRLVGDHLSAYERTELYALRENQAVGERILVVPRSVLADSSARSALESGDFWLFDAGTRRAHAILLGYTADGTPEPSKDLLITEPGRVAELTALARGVSIRAVPLNRYLAHASA